MKKSRALVALSAIAGSLFLAGCDSDADTASRNLSTAADHFEVQRRIVFVNGITGETLLLIEGRCSLGNDDPPREVSVTCKTGDDKYTKDMIGISDNVTFVSHQLEGAAVSPYYHRTVLKPQGLVPDLDVQGGAALPENQ